MPDPQLAEQALGRLMELSPEMRGGAILGVEEPPPAAAGEKRQAIIEADVVLAASGDADGWGDAARALLAVTDAGGEAAEQVHVATEAGEVFAVRDGDLVAVAVTERFVLASLMAFDMRSVLRDLAAGASSPEAAAGGGT